MEFALGYGLGILTGLFVSHLVSTKKNKKNSKKVSKVGGGGPPDDRDVNKV